MSNVAQDLVKNGLPAWVYTWKTVAAIAIAGPLIVMMIGSGVGLIAGLISGPSLHAPDCFTMIGADPLQAGSRKFDKENYDVAQVREDHKKTAEKLRELVGACSASTCQGADRIAFRRAAIVYMSGRGLNMQKMYVRYGEEGLRYVEQLYDTSYDVGLINALRRAFSAGLLDITRLHSDEPVVRMLLLKPLAQFRLCRAA